MKYLKLALLGLFSFALGCNDTSSELIPPQPFKAGARLRTSTSSVTFGAAPAITTGNWAQYRGPNAHAKSDRGDLPTQWSATEGIKWRSELPGAGSSSPIVFDDHVYVTASTQASASGAGEPAARTHHLICLDRITGKYLWKRDIRGEASDATTAANEFQWASSTPLCDGGNVFASFGSSGVFAFDSEGKFQWRRRLETDLDAQASPLETAVALTHFGDHLIVNSSLQNGKVVALDKSTGKIAWEISDVTDSLCMPVIAEPTDGKPELIVVDRDWVRGVDPLTGAELWRCAGLGGNVEATPFIEEGICYCNGGDPSKFTAIKIGGKGDVSETHKIWEVPCDGIRIPPVFVTGQLYLITESGAFQCYDARDGKRISSVQLVDDAEVAAAPFMGGTQIYVPLKTQGVLVCESNSEAKRTSLNVIEGDPNPLNSTFAASNNLLFLRNDGFLYCLMASASKASQHTLTDMGELEATFEVIVDSGADD